MDTIIHLENDMYVGQTQFSANLLKDAVALAVRDVQGVAQLGKKIKLNNANGIKIYEDEDGIMVDVFICIEYGYTVADVAYRVQETVMNSVRQLSNKKIGLVNIKVVGTKVTKRSEEIQDREQGEGGRDNGQGVK